MQTVLSTFYGQFIEYCVSSYLLVIDLQHTQYNFKLNMRAIFTLNPLEQFLTRDRDNACVCKYKKLPKQVHSSLDTS